MGIATAISMLKVLLLDDTPRRDSALRQALAALDGVTVACTLESAAQLAARVAEHQPDLVLVDSDSPRRGVLEHVAALDALGPRPVILFTGDRDEEAIRASLRAGVSSYIVDGLDPERLAPIMRVAIERFGTERKLRAELAETRARLADRQSVERAKGILMKQRGCTEDEAYAALRSLAMQRGIRIGEAARQVIDVASLLG